MGVKFNPFTGNLDLIDTTAAAGADTQIQFNNGGNLAGSADLTWDDTAKELGVGGDINLDDGGTYATTLQLITPTANRTISFPDATGTVGLVGGSSGQLVYNNAGAYAGAPSSAIGATGNITLSLAGAASTPPVSLTGTWFSGGTSTTTKPQLLIEPTGTTSTAWSTNGTGLGVNGASGFTGRLFDFQVNGSSKAVLTGAGLLGVGTTSPGAELHVANAAGNTEIRIGNVQTFDHSRIFTTTDDLTISNQRAANLILRTAATERARIDSSGRLLVGTSSARNSAAAIQVETAGSAGTEVGRVISLTYNAGAQARAGFIEISKTRGTSNGQNTIVANGDALGEVIFSGADGSDLIRSAKISAEVDGTPGANDMPSRLVFSTTADGSNSPTEQLRITNDRYVRLASGSGGIQFNGDTAAANALDDYEEGTWTPVVADAASGGNTGTFATNYSWYRKIGNTVFVFAEVYDINTTGLTAGNTFWVLNLPFNISPGKVFAGWGSVAPLASQTSLGIPFANSALSTTGYRISYCKSSTTGSALVSDLTSGATDLFGGLAYYV